MWKPVVTPVARVDPVGHVAAQLECEDPRHVRGQRRRLQVEHQLDVLVVRIGHAVGRRRQLARFAARVERLHLLDAALDLAHVREVVVEPRAVGRADRRLQLADRFGDPVEDASVAAAARRPRGRRGADAEQLIEHRARVANHRQRLGRRGPADRVGVGARVAVEAAAGLVDVLDAQLHRRDRRVLPELSSRRSDRARSPPAGPTPGSGAGATASGTPRRSGSDRRRFPCGTNASALRTSVLLTIVR